MFTEFLESRKTSIQKWAHRSTILEESHPSLTLNPLRFVIQNLFRKTIWLKQWALLSSTLIQEIGKILGAVLEKSKKIIVQTDELTDGRMDRGQFIGPTYKVGESKNLYKNSNLKIRRPEPPNFFNLALRWKLSSILNKGDSELKDNNLPLSSMSRCINSLSTLKNKTES